MRAEEKKTQVKIGERGEEKKGEGKMRVRAEEKNTQGKIGERGQDKKAEGKI